MTTVIIYLLLANVLEVQDLPHNISDVEVPRALAAAHGMVGHDDAIIAFIIQVALDC